MIRTLRLYTYLGPDLTGPRRGVKWPRILQEFPDRRLETLAGWAPNIEVSVPTRKPRRDVLTVRTEVPGRRLVAAGREPPPKQRVTVEVWIRRTSPWVIAFDAGRLLADLASAVAIASLGGDPRKTTPLVLEPIDFTALETWVIDERHTRHGRLVGIKLYSTRWQNAEVDKIEVTAPDLTSLPGFRLLRNAASAVGYLAFIPPADGLASPRCRISRTGWLIVYGDELPDHRIDQVLSGLESVFKQTYPLKGYGLQTFGTRLR